MPFKVQPNQTVLFTGDSITDAQRRGANHPLGGGYVRMCRDLIEAKYPEHACTVLNTGVSGNNVRDLYDRWTDDVIGHQPDWLSIMIGINDCHHVLVSPDRAVTPEQYADLYPKILDRVKRETDAKLVLMTPFYVSEAPPDESQGRRGRVAATLPRYIETVEKMAREYDAVLVQLQDMFQRQIRLHRPDDFGDEPVHPNQRGHLLMAYQWLAAMDW